MICTKSTFENLRSILEEYGGMDVPEDPKDPDELTWADVCRTVGPDGSYVRVVLINSIFGGGGTGFSFLYANGESTYPGYMSDAWYNGRYFNRHEYFEKGTKFSNAPKASIVLKDVQIRFPKAPEGKVYLYNYDDIGRYSAYNAATGVWSGFTCFDYDEVSGTWIASIDWSNARSAFEQSLVDMNVGWFVYIKFYVNHDGCIKPLVVGKSGSLLVNSNGSDISFSIDVNDGPARRFLIEEDLEWCKTQIAVLPVDSEEEALYIEKEIGENELFYS